MSTITRLRFISSLLAITFLASTCGAAPPANTLHVAAATSLTGVFQDFALEFETISGIPVTVSFASTGQLAQQIRNGAPYDILAAADADHIDALIGDGYLDPTSRIVFAQGELIVILPPDSQFAVNELSDLDQPGITRIAIANPEHAPYGIAAVEALTRSNLWSTLEPRILYGESVKQAAVIVATGNADAGIVARSVLDEDITWAMTVSAALHRPILHVAARSLAANPALSTQFLSFLQSPGARALLASQGLLSP